MNLPQRLAQLDVNPGGRLIEHDDRRLVYQRLRHQHAALHAAGQRAHIGVGLVGQVEVVHHLVDPGIVVFQAKVTGLQAQRFAHGEERVEHQFLRHHAQLLARGAEIADHIVAVDLDRAGVRPDQAGDDGNQGGLAGAIRPEQAEEFAFFNAEGHAAQCLERLVALLDITNLDRCHA